MKHIPLTQGMFSIVDDADFEELSQFKWHASKRKGGSYAERSVYQKTRIPKIISMHAQILGNIKGFIIDHINGNPLDNRRSNLRHATRQENSWNSKSRLGTSIFKGVTFHKRIKQFAASIRINGKLLHLGYYRNQEDAAHAYNAAAVRVFGKFARLNNI